MSFRGRICSKGIWDETIPGINFDENGISNYAHLFYRLCEAYPRGEKGKSDWEKIVNSIKSHRNRHTKYDCIIGVSGGTDSSFLMHVLKKTYNLNPLALTFDNGWSSEIAVKNIRKITAALNIDLETYVIDFEEMKSIHKAYMRAAIPWIDTPVDMAIKNVLLLAAEREKIKYVINGHDFRSEGTQPNEWTHGDSRQLNHIIEKFSNTRIKSFPYVNYYYQIYLSIVKKITNIKPLFYLNYSKHDAQEFLVKEYGWEYYGGHHHENVFTKYVLTDWMLNKFNIDKRKITLSAQVLSGEISRSDAIDEISKSPVNENKYKTNKDYVLKKLEISQNEYNKIWNSPNKSIYDYPSYLDIFSKYYSMFKPFIKIIYKQTPTFLFQLEQRKKK